MFVDFVSFDSNDPEIRALSVEDPCQHIGFPWERRPKHLDPRLRTMPPGVALLALIRFDGDVDEMRIQAERVVSLYRNPPAWAQLVLNK